jgi:hypothetical protein
VIGRTSTVGPRAARSRLEAARLPTAWVRVLERHPEGLATLDGWVWLDVPGKLRHVPVHDLEFTAEPPGRLRMSVDRR